MKNILIVDDNPQDLSLLQTLLKRHGYGVTAAANGAEALEKARSERPDMIITDILMPTMDGFALCREWKRDDILKNIPFVFFTATYTDLKDRKFALGLGADRFIGKPQEQEVFLGMIEEVFSDEKAGRLAAPCAPQHDEAVFNREYNETLIRKLENKMVQLEEANRRLELEVAGRKKSERALKESEEKFRVIFESSKDGIVLVDVDSKKFLMANNTFCDMVQYTLDEIRQLGILDVHPEEDVPWIIVEFDRRARHESLMEIDIPVKRKDGSIFWVEIKSSPMTITGKNYVVGNFRDVTKRRKSDEALARLGMAVDQSPEGVIITDREGRIQYANPAFERTSGYSMEEVVGKNPETLLGGKQEVAFYQELWGTLARGEVWTGHLIQRRKDGSLYEEDATISPVRDSSENIICFVGVMRDVTQILLLEKQVRTAQKMEAVGTLAGGIAHDFNNVLTVILGYGEMLKLRIANDPMALSDLDQIQRSAEHASVLTRQLLTFARRQVIDPANLDLNEVTTGLVKLLRKVTRENIELKTFLAEGVPTIRADQGQVEQVLMNLTLNARDAMPGGGQLVVETQEAWLDEEYVKQHPYMKAGRYAVLSVSDTGIGMDEGTRERIFEPFFTTKGPDKGTGLGLAVVYGVVKQHNGFIHVYSEPGKGTTLRIYFPAVDVPPDSRVVAAREIIHGGNETILLAEDNESVRHLAEQTLITYGYRVLTACDGEEAVDIFRRHGKEIAIVVLDMVMPNKGGKQAYDEMIATDSRVKAIFMSGYSANAIHDSFVLHPGIPFLQKPFAPSDLARMVREVLAGR
jgi:two-component system NtrC family sensor kinase